MTRSRITGRSRDERAPHPKAGVSPAGAVIQQGVSLLRQGPARHRLQATEHRHYLARDGAVGGDDGLHRGVLRLQADMVGFLVEALDPVSYTHLDVYKRQVITFFSLKTLHYGKEI